MQLELLIISFMKILSYSYILQLRQNSHYLQWRIQDWDAQRRQWMNSAFNVSSEYLVFTNWVSSDLLSFAISFFFQDFIAFSGKKINFGGETYNNSSHFRKKNQNPQLSKEIIWVMQHHLERSFYHCLK